MASDEGLISPKHLASPRSTAAIPRPSFESILTHNNLHQPTAVQAHLKTVKVKPKGWQVQPDREGVSGGHSSAYRTVMLHLDLATSLAADLEVWIIRLLVTEWLIP